MRDDKGGGGHGFAGIETQVGVGVLAHLFSKSFPGSSVKLEQPGINMISGAWFKPGFAEGNVPQDVWIHPVLAAKLVGKFINLLGSERRLRFWSRRRHPGRSGGGSWSVGRRNSR